MRGYPETAFTQLEFDKVKALLSNYTRTPFAKERAEQLRIHTKKDFILQEIRQSYEYLLLLQQQQHFPNDFTASLQKELKLLELTLRDEKDLFDHDELTYEERNRYEINTKILEFSKDKNRFNYKDDSYKLPDSYEDGDGRIDKKKKEAVLTNRYIEEYIKAKRGIIC